MDLNDSAALFVHERTAPGGRQYLVVVRFEAGFRRPRFPIAGLRFNTFRKYGFAETVPYSPVDSSIMKAAHPPCPPLVFMVGQPDPGDAAHFTIDYTLGGSKGTIDGRVDDDGNVMLRP
jgi:hypothetical protein